MKIVVQRVSQASVKVSGEIVGEISQGLLLLVGIEENDEKEDAEWLSKKILDLRIFSDEEGKMNRSVKDINGEILCVFQGTYKIIRLKNRKRNLRSGYESLPPK